MQSFIFASEHLLTNQIFKILIREKDRYILALVRSVKTKPLQRQLQLINELQVYVMKLRITINSFIVVLVNVFASQDRLLCHGLGKIIRNVLNSLTQNRKLLPNLWHQSQVVRAHLGQSNLSFFPQKRKKEILLSLVIFTYFKVQEKGKRSGKLIIFSFF